jgi:glutamine synthetase
MNAAPADHDVVAERLRSDHIETVLCAVPDIWGRLMGKRVTTATFLKTVLGTEGLHGSLYLFVVDMDMDPRPGYDVSSWETGFSDFRLVPDLGTLRTVPWLPATAIVICDAYHEDRRSSLLQSWSSTCSAVRRRNRGSGSTKAWSRCLTTAPTITSCSRPRTTGSSARSGAG